MAITLENVLVGNLGRDPAIRYLPSCETVNYNYNYNYKQPNGREHAPTLSISDDITRSAALQRSGWCNRWPRRGSK